MQSSDDYRSVYCRLLDDPDFQALTPEAQRLWFFMRLSSECGPTGLFRWYPPVTWARMRTTPEAMKAPLQELLHGRWIELEGGYVLIRNAMRFEPTFRPAQNSKHLTAIHRHLSPLGHLTIARQLLDDLGLGYPPEWNTDGDALDARSRAQRSLCHKAVARALKSGKLIRQPCEACGSPDSLAHHEDYEKPLEVHWLCELHHQERHRQIAAGIPYGRFQDRVSRQESPHGGSNQDTLSPTSGSTATVPAPATATATAPATVAVDGAAAATTKSGIPYPEVPELPPDESDLSESPSASQTAETVANPEGPAFPWHEDDERDFGSGDEPHARWNDYVEWHMAKRTPAPWPRFLGWLREDLRRRVQIEMARKSTESEALMQAHERRGGDR